MPYNCELRIANCELRIANLIILLLFLDIGLYTQSAMIQKLSDTVKHLWISFAIVNKFDL